MSTVIVGLFDGVESVAKAGRALRELSLPAGSVTTISAVPLPDGAVVTDPAPIRFPKIVIAGWFVGAAAGLALTLATYMLYPLVTGGKTIVSVPPTLIITYEVAMLGGMTLATAPLTGGTPKAMAEQVSSADWSPDGAQLAFVSTSRDHKSATVRVAAILSRPSKSMAERF